MHRFPRLSARALAGVVLVVSSLVGACGGTTQSSSPIPPIVPAANQAPIRDIRGISLVDAVREQNDARFYTWAAALPTPVPDVPRPPRRSRPSAPVVVVDGDRFDRLAACESGQNPTDLSPGGTYRGAFQFSLSTWHAAGMAGDPIDYSYAEQKAAAESWSTRSNPSGQWPVCWARSA